MLPKSLARPHIVGATSNDMRVNTHRVFNSPNGYQIYYTCEKFNMFILTTLPNIES